jgi:hypothetical protein
MEHAFGHHRVANSVEGHSVEFASSALMNPGRRPMPGAMSIRCARPRAPLATAVSLTLAACALAGCGTPAVVKPVQDPLPGFKRDIQAARNAAARSGQEAEDLGATGVTTP